MTLNIRAVHIELTPAIKQYVEEKFNMLEKYSHKIQLIEVEVGMDSKHHQKGDIFTCKAVVTLGGDVVKVEKQEEDMYKSIDKVKDHLAEILIKHKEKEMDDHRRHGDGAEEAA